MKKIATLIPLFALAIPAAAANYTITDLGSFVGMTGIEPFAISDTGYIAGRWAEGSGPSRLGHGFIWHEGMITDIVYNGESTELRGVNDAGQATGSYYRTYPDADYGFHAFIWEDGAFTPLGTLPQGVRGVGYQQLRPGLRQFDECRQPESRLHLGRRDNGQSGSL